MNDEPQNPADETLQRLMTAALGPESLSDKDIASYLSSMEPTESLGEDQVHRMLSKVKRLLETTQVNSQNNVADSSDSYPDSANVQATRAQRPKLISIVAVEPGGRSGRAAAVTAMAASMMALLCVVLMTQSPTVQRTVSQADPGIRTIRTLRHRGLARQLTDRFHMTAKPIPERPLAARVSVGDEILTGNLERRRVALPDGSVLYVNSNSQVKIASERRVDVSQGEVFVEVVPTFGQPADDTVRMWLPGVGIVFRNVDRIPFEVVTPNRTVTAMGTKFSVSVVDQETDVMVTQGKVKVSGVDETLIAGKELRARQLEESGPLKSAEYVLTSAPQASAALEWTRDLMAAATGPLVAKSEYSGGALVTVDPNGQSSKLSLRNYHIDVHIEDGFARTTIDQTYFNHTHSRLEGTFHFPLPTDASLSRLAMYVNGKRMEGGMAERDHARNTFEEIKRKMLDPALLEWVDGSTFKMRVFPLEPRQEKRIILSYSQRLPSNDGHLSYRFPAGHTMDVVRDWSAHIVVKNGVGRDWNSQSHVMTATESAGHLVLDAALKNALLDKDLVLRVADDRDLKTQISNFKSEDEQYLMLRLRPDLVGELKRERHHWMFLFEHSGDRTPLLARAQVEIVRTLLNNAEHDDTFSIVKASSRATVFGKEPTLCTADNIAAAMRHLESVHLVGALDLAAAFLKCAEQITLPHLIDNGLVPRTKILVHVGSGMPALGERDAAKLAAMIPAETQYVGIGVGRRWNAAMMKQAASRTAGLSTQINPDEEIAWRAFEVFSKLHSPRLVNVAVTAKIIEQGASSTVPSPPGKGEKVADRPDEGAGFLLFEDTITQGEELAAICRIPDGQPLPKEVIVTATLNGQPWTQTVSVENVRGNASYLPRHWAKLEIDRLLAENAQQHRESIIALSKSMYVMSPFTSLLVLENDEMYTQFNVDRGRKDHWALYACPETVEAVAEKDNDVAPVEALTKNGAKTLADVMESIVRLPGAGVPTRSIQRTYFYPGPAALTRTQVYPFYTFRGPNHFFDLNAAGRIPRFGLSQSTPNAWFRDYSNATRFDVDYDDDGIREGVWIDLPPVSTFSNGIATDHFTTPELRGRSTNFVRPDLDWDDTTTDEAKFQQLLAFNEGVRERETASFMPQLNSVDMSFIMSPGDFSLPDAKSWRELAELAELAERRKKYDRANNRDLTASELQIESGLRQKVSLHFHDAPLTSVIRHIANEHGINIAMKTRAIETEGLTADPLVSIDVDGITLKSSLNLLLDQAGGLAYSIENDTLMITTAAAQKAIHSDRQAVSDVESLLARRRQGRRWDAGAGLEDSDPAINLRGEVNIEQLQDLGLLIVKGNEADVAKVQAIINLLESPAALQQPAFFDRLQISPGDLADPRQNGRDARYGIGALATVAPSGIAVCTIRMPVTPLINTLQEGDRVDLWLTDNTLSGTKPVGTRKLLPSIEIFSIDHRIEYAGNHPTKAITFFVNQKQGKIINTTRKNGTVSICGNSSDSNRGIGFSVNHRWSQSSIDSEAAPVALPTFQTVADASFAINPTIFGDLISHAPGLNTSAADVMAVVDREAENLIVNAPPVPSPPGKGEKVADRPDEGAASETAPPKTSNAKSQSPRTLALSPESGERGQQKGRMDEAARLLIEKSRARGWESILLPGRDGDAGITVHYDGQGRHVWERVVSEGLREHVVCDGSTLWHVYREIGLASKRPFSRFHHREFTNIVPWLLPSVEDLTRGADIVAVDERTVALVPRAKSVPSPPGKGEKVADRPDEGAVLETAPPKKSTTESQSPLTLALSPESGERGQSQDTRLVAVHLVFADDGRLVERRIVDQASSKILRRVTFSADGTIKVLDAEGAEFLTAKLNRSLAVERKLVPDLNGLVVLPMPVRKAEVLTTRTTDKDGQATADEELSEDDAISLMLAYMANGNGARMVDIARKRFIDKGDMRDGLYVLLSRFPQALVQASDAKGLAKENAESQSTPGLTPPGSPGFDLRPPVEGSPLKQFVRQYVNRLRDSAPWQPGSGGIAEFRIDAPDGSFLQRMATARNLYVRWLTDSATKDLTQSQVQQEVDTTLNFIGTCRTLDMGWALMNIMRPRLTTPEHLAAFAKAAERFEQHPQVGLLVRRERMTTLCAAGKQDEAMKLFSEWLSVHLANGIVPPIGKELYDSLAGDSRQQAMSSLLLVDAKRLVESDMLMTLNSLAVQMRELGNTKVADQMLGMVLASLDSKQRPDVSVVAIEQLRQLKDPRADKLLDQVMGLPWVDQLPSLWRFASVLAEESGHKRLAAERLEHAIQLEFATRPTTINIEIVRLDYSSLLTMYDELIAAATTLEIAPAADLADRIIQAADQWRTLDEDGTVACRTASRLLARLDRKDLTWDYLTTPLAENSGESAPWIALAQSLGADQQTDMASMAWTQAFELESTNPEILIEHARLMQTAGQTAVARELLNRVILGSWQPRFSSSVQNATSLLNSL